MSDPLAERTGGADLGRRLIIRNVEIAGPGAIILTGPSELRQGRGRPRPLCELLNISRNRWLSMGDILRHTYERAREPDFVALLEQRYNISDRVPILNRLDTTPDLARKVESSRASPWQPC